MEKNFLSIGDVHIWSASLLDFERYINYLLSVLSADEQRRADNFRFSRDRKRFIIARGILRCLLSSYLGQFPQNIDIAYSLFGKPYLPAKESLHFNISHSGDNALYAITNYYKIGIDLEYIDRNIDLDGLAFDIFSPLELTHWQKMMSYEKADFFFKSWVCKEAFLKASGKGWLAHQKDQIFKKPPLLIQKHKNIYSRKKIKYPYCFDSIDGYASALHVVGPSLHPSHYIWKRSSLENTINLQN